MEYGCSGARQAVRRVDRRRFLTVGALGLGGLTLADALCLREAGAASRDDYAAILLWLTGGPSQFDTFDPKPDGPTEVKGPFEAIPTSLDGCRFSEVFEKSAKHAHRMAVMRSVYHPLDHHVLAQGWMTAGRVHDTMNYPPMGSVMARVKPQNPVMPSFVTVPRLKGITGYNETQHYQTAGDLGPAFNPLIPNGVPGEKDFALRDMSLPEDVNAKRFARRSRLLQQVNRSTANNGPKSPNTKMEAIYEKALELVHSSAVHGAFGLGGEPDKLRDSYGRNGFGQSCLLARRLVENGVRFVTVNWPDFYAWDQHSNIKDGVKKTGGVLDAALSSLLEDLSQRGMLERTLVMVMGEFGRTPRVNPSGGRDHWTHGMTVLMAGAGIRGGQVWGGTGHDGYPNDRPLHARDMVATAYQAIGINPRAEVETMSGRPYQLLQNCEPVRAVLQSRV